jgi:hypothetical protein
MYRARIVPSYSFPGRVQETVSPNERVSRESVS